MITGRAHAGCLSGLVNKTAITASPGDLAVFLEDFAGIEVIQQVAVAFLVLLLGDADHVEDGGDLLEAFLASLRCEGRVEFRPFLVLATGCRLQVFRRGRDDPGGESGRDLRAAALEELEESLGVLFLLVRRFQEDV